MFSTKPRSFHSRILVLAPKPAIAVATETHARGTPRTKLPPTHTQTFIVHRRSHQKSPHQQWHQKEKASTPDLPKPSKTSSSIETPTKYAHQYAHARSGKGLTVPLNTTKPALYIATACKSPCPQGQIYSPAPPAIAIGTLSLRSDRSHYHVRQHTICYMSCEGWHSCPRTYPPKSLAMAIDTLSLMRDHCHH